MQEVIFCSLSISYTKVSVDISSFITGSTTQPVKAYNVVYSVMFSGDMRSFVMTERITPDDLGSEICTGTFMLQTGRGVSRHGQLPIY